MKTQQKTIRDLVDGMMTHTDKKWWEFSESEWSVVLEMMTGILHTRSCKISDKKWESMKDGDEGECRKYARKLVSEYKSKRRHENPNQDVEVSGVEFSDLISMIG